MPPVGASAESDVEAAPSSAEPSGRPADPHGLARLLATLSGGTAKRARSALAAAAVLLDGDETAQGLICGQYLANDGVVVLTERRLLCVNDREHAPDHESIALDDLDDVKGWIEGNRATLRIDAGDTVVVIGDIKEVESAQKFAGDLRTNL